MFSWSSPEFLPHAWAMRFDDYDFAEKSSHNPREKLE